MTAPTLDALRCSFCEHANPTGAKFCNDCGSPLRLKPCERCDAINDLDATSCHQCGAEFDEGLAVDVDAGPATTTPIADFKPSILRAFETASAPAPPASAETFPSVGGSLTPIADAAIVEPARPAPVRRRKALAALFVFVLVGGVYGVYRYANSVDGSRVAMTAAPGAGAGTDATTAAAGPSKPIRVASPDASSAAPAAATATAVTGKAAAAPPAAAPAADTSATTPAGAATASPTLPAAAVSVGAAPASMPAATASAVSAATAPAAAAEQRRTAAARAPRGARGRTRSQPAPGASATPALPVAPAATVRPAPVAPANCTAGVAALGLCTRP